MGIFGDSPKFEFFQGKNSKIPKVKLIPIPKISPKIFWGFSGIKPQKNSKFNLPSSPKNPQNFSKPCPRPRPVPEIRGRGRGKSGIGAPFPHPNWHRTKILNKIFLCNYNFLFNISNYRRGSIEYVYSLQPASLPIQVSHSSFQLWSQ